MEQSRSQSMPVRGLGVASKQTKMAERMVATLFAVMQEADIITEEEDDNMESFFATVIAM
jgi:hypothetical protein